MQLNIGCGPTKADGWAGLDIEDFGQEVIADCTHLPFEDDSIDRVMAIHLVANISVDDATKMASEVHRALKPDGEFLVECPDIRKVLAAFYKFGLEPDAYPLTYRGLFGDERLFWCYSGEQLTKLLYDAGFDTVREVKPHFHEPLRDMAWLARKRTD